MKQKGVHYDRHRVFQLYSALFSRQRNVAKTQHEKTAGEKRSNEGCHYKIINIIKSIHHWYMRVVWASSNRISRWYISSQRYTRESPAIHHHHRNDVVVWVWIMNATKETRIFTICCTMHRYFRNIFFIVKHGILILYTYHWWFLGRSIKAYT